MRLFELMNVITPSAVRVVESRPVDNAYMQRIIQPATKAPNTPQEIEQLIRRAKIDPAFSYKGE